MLHKVTRDPDGSPRVGSSATLAALVACLLSCQNAPPSRPSADASADHPSLTEVLASGRDLWGEAAMRRPDGPSYDFFARLLPPLRYVNAEFRHYPIVLSAPGSARKARLVSNGSAVNARAGLNAWSEVGFPVAFRVGPDEAVYGEDLARLEGPRYAEGHLPIVQTTYRHGGATYAQEAFAPVDAELATNAAVCVSFALREGGDGFVTARVGTEAAPQAREGFLFDKQGRGLAHYDASWRWEAAAGKLVARLARGQSASLIVFSEPARVASPPLTPERAAALRRQCVETWEALLRRGARFDVPEPLVNDAWRSLVVGTFMLLKGDALCYSIGNAYERQFEAECGDAVRALLLFGHAPDARRMIGPLLEYRQRGLAFHDAAFKLQLLAHVYWITRDGAWIRDIRPRWAVEVARILQGREAASGLLPRENYCGDINRQVVTLNSNANCWRGLRDMAAVLADLGERDEARRLAEAAAEFRRAILAAVEKSERRDVTPPFIPIALFGDEKPYERLTDSMLGSYWDLMAPYVLGSGVFGPGAAREGWICDTLHERGGVCMGMIRFHQHSGQFANESGVDDLYGLRYVEALLRRDEVDRALVSFYGKLAHGLTRDTFIGAEGTGLVPLDDAGRPMYLPPNSSSDALFLWTLRGLLVQDEDADDDGRPDTLRLLPATPRPWLRDGSHIRVERAPTAFGEVSIEAMSRLADGEVLVRIDAPPRRPERMTLRLRLPDGWRIVAARAGERSLSPDDRGTVDISGMDGRITCRFEVRRVPR